jgi:uncharacterized RDD family membrane protein YckC
MKDAAPPLPGTLEGPAVLAPRWARVVGYVVDVFLVGGCSQVAELVHATADQGAALFVVLLAVLAVATTASPLRATPGMAFAHVRLCASDGRSDPNLLQVVVRALVAGLLGATVVLNWWGLVPYGIALAMGCSPAGRTAWDLVARTTVVADWRPGRFR